MQMKSTQKTQITRFSKAKTFFSYFLVWYYLMFSTFAYAGHSLLEDEIKTGSDITATQTLKKPLEEFQEDPASSAPINTTPSHSYSLSPQNVVLTTFDWMHELALSSCDHFGKSIGSYAKDLPPAYFAKSFLEVDYAHDDLFWEGHFIQELEKVKAGPYLGLKEHKILKNLQSIVWNGLLSPYFYEEELQNLKKKKLFSQIQEIRQEFESELKENPDVVLQHLRKDLVNSLEEMQNDGERTINAALTDFKKKLIYYRNVLNAFDYAEVLAHLFFKVEENKEQLSLSRTQYKDFMGALNDALDNVDKEEYFQIEKEREFNHSLQDAADTLQAQKLICPKAGDTDVDNTQSTYFSYLLSFANGASALLQRSVSFSIKNPMHAITTVLALQVAGVTAKSSFSLPQLQNAKRGLCSATFLTHNDEEGEDVKHHNNIQKMQSRANDINDWFSESASSVGNFNGAGYTEAQNDRLESLETEVKGLVIANAEEKQTGEEVKQEIGILKKQLEEYLKESLTAKQNIEILKKQLESTQNKLDIHIKAYEVEQQREEQEKVALREKFALWNSRIDIRIQRLKELQYDQLTYEELVSVLDAMEDHYDDGMEKDMMHVWREGIVIEASGFSYHEWRKRIGIILAGHRKNIVRSTEHDARHLIISVALLKKDVSEMMDKYRFLSGAYHPRWYEFSKM